MKGDDFLSSKFLRQLELLNVSLNKGQQEQFYRFYEILVEWNKVMNLTGITDYEEVNEKHFIDSLSVINVIDLNKVNKVIDIGTGAGFPGIPLKIAFPHLDIVLLDSLQKRVNFLDKVIDELNFENIITLHGRAEDYARQLEYREEFDLCVSRAVANLSVLSEYCIPYVKVNGYFVPYKSGNIDEEVKLAETAIRVLGGRVDDILKFSLPDSDIERSFIKIYKEKVLRINIPEKLECLGKILYNKKLYFNQ